MDQRLHKRVPVNRDARIVDLSGRVRPQDCRFLDVSIAGICVVAASPLAVADLVRVDFSEGCLFGQVVHVTPEGTEFRTGVEVFNVLLGRSDLARLIERTLGQASLGANALRVSNRA